MLEHAGRVRFDDAVRASFLHDHAEDRRGRNGLLHARAESFGAEARGGRTQEARPVVVECGDDTVVDPVVAAGERVFGKVSTL